MTVCPLLYSNLSNFIRLGLGPSYKFWEVINYRRGINDVAQSLIPMTICPLLYHCPFSSNLQLTLSQSILSTPSTSFFYHTMGKYNNTLGSHGRDAHCLVPAEASSSGPHAGRAEGMAMDYAWRMHHTNHHQPHLVTQWWVIVDGGGHQCLAPATCTVYPSSCAVPADGACVQTLVPWAARQGQSKQRHVTHEGGTLPAKASSWCSKDGVLTRLVGEVQRLARDQVISPFWGK